MSSDERHGEGRGVSLPSLWFSTNFFSLSAVPRSAFCPYSLPLRNPGREGRCSSKSLISSPSFSFQSELRPCKPAHCSVRLHFPRVPCLHLTQRQPYNKYIQRHPHPLPGCGDASFRLSRFYFGKKKSNFDSNSIKLVSQNYGGQ